MTEPPAAAEAAEPRPDARPAASNRRRLRRLQTLAAESAMIVFSVLLALLANEWRASRAERATAEATRAHFAREVSANLDVLEGLIPYHRGVLDRLAARRDTPTSFEALLAEAAPEDLRTPALEAASWDMAIASGTLRLLDPDLSIRLASLYREQQQLVGGTVPRLLNVYYGPLPEASEPTRPLYLLVRELVVQEIFLADTYRDALRHLDPAALETRAADPLAADPLAPDTLDAKPAPP